MPRYSLIVRSGVTEFVGVEMDSISRAQNVQGKKNLNDILRNWKITLSRSSWNLSAMLHLWRQGVEDGYTTRSDW